MATVLLARQSNGFRCPQVSYEINEMARGSYGYGRWEAPYWFIWPEQGQAREENDDLTARVEAWRRLGGGELVDCRNFHDEIGEKRWHREIPNLQPTWRPLILLLMTYLGRPTDKESLRNYQRTQWATLEGETCLIDLSGLAANSFEVPRDREQFEKERITVIRHRMRDYKPRLVIMYGLGEQSHWNEIAESSILPDGIQRLGKTLLAFARHPTSHGSNNAYWTDFGERLRLLS